MRHVTGHVIRCGRATLCITVFVVFGAVVRGRGYNIGGGSNRLFEVVEVGTSLGPPSEHGDIVIFVNTLVFIAKTIVPLRRGGSRTIVCQPGLWPLGPPLPCVILTLPEYGLLTSPSLPHLPFVLRKVNGNKQALQSN